MFNRFGMVLCYRVRDRWYIVKKEEEELEKKECTGSMKWRHHGSSVRPGRAEER